MDFRSPPTGFASDALKIHGQRPLHGSVRVNGAKNAALPAIAASLLTDEPIVLRRVPRILDVEAMCELVAGLGVQTSRNHDKIVLRQSGAVGAKVPVAPFCRIRGSICVLGPLLARRGRAEIPLPGGCSLGERPINLHLRALRAMGVRVWVRDNLMRMESGGRLTAAAVDMGGRAGSSVTGTINVLAAAALARGKTVINNAATEPEVVDFGNLLLRMGAKVDGLGGSVVTVEGVSHLGPATHELVPDRIEAATLLVAAAMTGGSILVQGSRADHLCSVIRTLREMGVAIDRDATGLYCSRRDALRAVHVVARPYPAFPTDCQPLLSALLCCAEGQGVVQDTVFRTRSSHVPELRKLGADIGVQSDRIAIQGPSRLRGTAVRGRDLRATAALTLAGLAAEGVTTVHGISHLDRGYEQLDQRLARLGADVERVNASPQLAPPKGMTLDHESLPHWPSMAECAD